MRLERTQNAELIAAIVTHPAIWPHVSEGQSPEEWAPLLHETVYQLLIVDDDGIGGCFILVPQSSICWEVHTCILPSHRGEKARQAAKLCVDWMFDNAPCMTITTRVPAYNRPAYKLARSAGFHDIGMVKSAWVHRGSVQDVHLLEATKCQ